ncbi:MULTISPECIES: hypothetical protein [Bradyrhizobium]|nr:MULTISPECIES: hypothetical protein [unclassified Bradyrhizobium]
MIAVQIEAEHGTKPVVGWISEAQSTSSHASAADVVDYAFG